MPCNKRNHCSEKPSHCNEESPPLTTTGEKPVQQQRPSTAKNKYIKIQNAHLGLPGSEAIATPGRAINDQPAPDARVAAAAAMTDLEAELGQGYSYTCVAYLHPLSTNLSTNLSFLPGSVLAGPQKSEQFSPRQEEHNPPQLHGFKQPSPDRALCGPGSLRNRGRSGHLARARGGITGIHVVSGLPLFYAPTRPGGLRSSHCRAK